MLPFSFTEPLTLAELAAALRSREPLRLPPQIEAQLQHSYPPAATPTGPAAAHWLLAQACGTGPEVPPELVRRLLLLKAHSLSLAAPVNWLLLKRLLAFYTREVWPVIYEQGALETPLAHLALPLLGLGEVNYQGYRLAAADVLGLFGWEPLALTMPASRALLAGHEFPLAYATEALERAARVLLASARIAALGVAERASNPGPEALTEAARVAEAACNRLAPPDSLPFIFRELATTLAALGQASARRTSQWLAAPPAPETANFGGLLAVAASLAADSQRLAAPAAPHPPEVRRLTENTELLLGMELLAAAQAPERRPARSSPALAAVVAAFRAVVTFAPHDRVLTPDLHRAARFVREYEWA